MNEETLIRISTGSICAGIVLQNGRVIKTAPFFRPLLGLDEETMMKRLRNCKTWTWEIVSLAPNLLDIPAHKWDNGM